MYKQKLPRGLKLAPALFFYLYVYDLLIYSLLIISNTYSLLLLISLLLLLLQPPLYLRLELHFVSTYYGADTLTHTMYLIPTPIQPGFHHPHFTADETKAHSEPAQAHTLVSRKDKTQKF